MQPSIVNQMDDITPQFYRTRDSGTTWTEISSTAFTLDCLCTNAGREEPVRKGLLCCLPARKRRHVSFNDGERWQPLQLNLPPTRQ